MQFSNRHFMAMGAALLVLMACGLGVIYKTQGEFQLRAEQAAQAAARTQAAQQAGQRLARMALDVRSLLAGAALPEAALARHRDSLQWQHTKVEAALVDMVKAAAPTPDSAAQQVLASVGVLHRLYKQALASPRPGGEAVLDAGLLAAEAQAQQRMEDLQGVLARAAALDHARMLEGSSHTAQVAAVALLGGVATLALALFFGGWTAHHVERAKQAIRRRQQEMEAASAGLVAQVQTHLADGQAALQESLQAAHELAGHAERLLGDAKLAPVLAVPALQPLPAAVALPPVAPMSGAMVMQDPSPLALAAQAIERARRAAR